jgi:hypothetical protein
MENPRIGSSKSWSESVAAAETDGNKKTVLEEATELTNQPRRVIARWGVYARDKWKRVVTSIAMDGFIFV